MKSKMENYKNSLKKYTCPMHPEIRRDKPGMCPECGMQLLETQGLEVDNNESHHSGLDKHAGHSTRIFFRKFLVSLALTIPVVFYSDILEKIFGIKAPVFFGSDYLPFIFGSIVFFYGGWVFIRGAIREVQARLPGMMALIGLAVSAAYFYSLFSIVTASGTPLFWELTTLITVMLLGHWLEMRAVSGAQGALKELSKLLPDKAELVLKKVDSGALETKIVLIEELRVDDVVFVRPGGKIPADGVIIEGRSEADESMITGESNPVQKTVDAEVIAGTINGDGSLKIRVNKIGKETFLAGVMRLVEEAQASKSRLQILSDRAAFYLTFIAVFSGILTFIVWIVVGADFGTATERLVAVLVIACPHALGLAVPLVASISTTLAARNGFLVRQRLALEIARKVNIVLFDKTGTLTKGEYGVDKVWVVTAKDEKEVLQLAASVDAYSEHFISKAIVKKAKELGGQLFEVTDFARLPGKGIRGKVRGEDIHIGGAAMLEEFRLSLPEELRQKTVEEAKKGKTLIYVIRKTILVGVIALADLIREESRQAVRELEEIGVAVAMITGDSEEVAKWVAQELGIKEVFSRVLPQDKSLRVRLLQESGFLVAMVGDGINDAPALTQADLGIAIGAGTNVAIESAGIILVKSDPRDIVKIIKLSRRTYSKMLQNLFWATGYNIVALPLAAGALAFRGILLQPALAAVFMSLSTVIVAINALLLKKKNL